MKRRNKETNKNGGLKLIVKFVYTKKKKEKVHVSFLPDFREISTQFIQLWTRRNSCHVHMPSRLGYKELEAKRRARCKVQYWRTWYSASIEQIKLFLSNSLLNRFLSIEILRSTKHRRWNGVFCRFFALERVCSLNCTVNIYTGKRNSTSKRDCRFRGVCKALSSWWIVH